MNSCCMAVWKALRVFWPMVVCCSSIVVFSTSVLTPSSTPGRDGRRQGRVRGVARGDRLWPPADGPRRGVPGPAGRSV